MRALLAFLLLAFASASAPKGKAQSTTRASPPTASPTFLSLVQSIASTSQTNTTQGNSTQSVVTSTSQTNTTQSNSTQSASKGKAPTAAPGTVVLDLKVVAANVFRLIEAGQYDQASRMFASGMAYITNGRQYDLDLSNPLAIKSIPKRNRTQCIWTYVDHDNYELWGHCLVNYPNNPQAEPEFLLIHFNKNGLIDVFSHVEPKAAQCASTVKSVTKLALLRTDGSVVDAPQDQLARMMAQQQAANALANSTGTNHTATNSSRVSNVTSTVSNTTTTSTSTVSG